MASSLWNWLVKNTPLSAAWRSASARRRAVLVGAGRVEELELEQDVRAARRDDLAQADGGRIADGVEDGGADSRAVGHRVPPFRTTARGRVSSPAAARARAPPARGRGRPARGRASRAAPARAARARAPGGPGAPRRRPCPWPPWPCPRRAS